VLALSLRKKTAMLMKAKLPKICSFIFCVAELDTKGTFSTFLHSNSPHFSPKIKNQTLASSKAEKNPYSSNYLFLIEFRKVVSQKIKNVNVNVLIPYSNIYRS
jgi:hypothetical protein